MAREIPITPQADAAQVAVLNRQVHRLDRLLDNPFSGPQPIAQAGMLERLGSALWEVAGLQAEELLAAIDHARDTGQPVRILVTDAAAHHWPWEVLYHPHPELGFVGRHPWCVVARRFRGDGQKAPQVLPRPLRLLA